MNDNYAFKPIRSSQARTYMKSCLEDGHRLSRQLLKDHDFDRGEIVVILPKSTRNVSKRKPSLGGLANNQQSTAVLAQFLRFCLKLGCLCLFENQLARKSDPFLRKCHSKVRFLNEQVYHIMEPSQEDLEVVRTIREANNSIGLVGSIGFSAFRHTKKRVEGITASEISNLSKNTISVIVGAFDGESYMLWINPEIGWFELFTSLNDCNRHDVKYQEI